MTTTVSKLSEMPAVWLRDNCCCPDCRDPRNGQKLFAVTDIETDLSVRDIDGTTVTFSDGHVGQLDPALVIADADVDDRCEDAKNLWVTTEPHVGDWARFQADASHRADCFDAVLRKGFTLLHGVPTEAGTVLEVAARLGYVRETNYGKLFDVRVEATPTNLAFTGLPIGPHTDNPYRDPVPTVQLLHCLSNAVEGGESGLVDGFQAAAELRAEDAVAFGILASTPVTFRFRDTYSELTATKTLISVNPTGRICEVRFNNRSMQAVRVSPEAASAFYEAYRKFAELLVRRDHMVTFRLSPGECVIFDNTRMSHARTGFADSGDRHLQGCYVDLDSIASQLRVLHGELMADRRGEIFEGPGLVECFGEDVTQSDHMLQAAALAENDGAPSELVVAALLHDIGYFIGTLTGNETMNGIDEQHDRVAADWLAGSFGAAVTEPIRLHVAAKRYLCAVDPSYYEQLSDASKHSLNFQGGPMSPEERDLFEANLYAVDAVRLRRWDEAAKLTDVTVAPYDHYAPMVAQLAR